MHPGVVRKPQAGPRLYFPSLPPEGTPSQPICKPDKGREAEKSGFYES